MRTPKLRNFPEECIDKRFGRSTIRTNERIRAREIRVIDENGAQLGVMQPFEALKIARERGFDLVEISATANPPVCRIQDYGKFLYEKEKQERAAKKNQKVITIKEVKFRINVDEHDYEFKKNHVLRFLEFEDGHLIIVDTEGAGQLGRNFGRVLRRESCRLTLFRKLVKWQYRCSQSRLSSATSKSTESLDKNRR